MAFYDKYPYTDFHELNLDWVIKTTSDMRKDVDYLLEEFAKIKVLTREEIQAMIDASCAVVIKYSDDQDALLKADLEGQLTEQYTKVTNEYKAYTTKVIADFKVYVDAQDVIMLNAAKDYTDDAKRDVIAYIDDKVITVTQMFNPMRGYLDDVRNVVDDIIDNYLKVNAISAGEYDALSLTAAAYDAYNITAYNYDFNGKTLLA